jgi:transposase
MLNVEQRFMIKDLYRQGVSISEIARQTGHDRKTIRAVLKEPLTPTRRAYKPKIRKLDAYAAYLEQRIGAGVLNAQKLYQEIVGLGYVGKDRQVRAFVQRFRQGRRPVATMRFETEPGQQGQVDWGAFGLTNHQGRRCRLYAFVMTLGWSRAMYVEFTLSMEVTWWLRCHIHAFHYFGGVPQEILHDNLKTAVLSRSTDGVIHWHPRYLDFANYYGFRPHACQPYRAQTKGKVESGIRYVRHNFWPGLVYRDLDDLNQQCRHWLDTVANVRIHATTQVVPQARLAQEGLLSATDKPDYDTTLLSYRRSSKDCLVSYRGNYYSVPALYAQQTLMLKETEQGELLIWTPEGVEVAVHHLAEGRRQRVIRNSHYATLNIHTHIPTKSGALQLPQGDALALSWQAPQVEMRSLRQYETWVEAMA